MKLAIASTCRGFQPEFRTALEYHAHQGVDCFFLVLDDPLELQSDFVRSIQSCPLLGPRLHFIPNDADFKKQVVEYELYRAFEEIYDRSLGTRQRVNLAIVSKIALAAGVDWVIHIDTDELIDPGDGPNLRAYFESIPESIDEVLILNREAMPDLYEYRDPFKEIVRFKKNAFERTQLQNSYLQFRLTKPEFFIAYDNFKPAFRPRAVQKFDQGSVSAHQFHPDYLEDEVRVAYLDPIRILHYPMCGVKSLIKRIAGFNASRIYMHEALNPGDPNEFFTALRRASKLRDPVAAMRTFYETRILYEDPEEIAGLRKFGLFVEKPVGWLDHLNRGS